MLENWVNPSVIAKESFTEKSFGSSIIFFDKNTDTLDAKIALLGVDKAEADAVRKQLFSYSNIKLSHNVTDLGNLKKNDIDFVTMALKEIIDSGMILIVLGSSVLNIESQFKAYYEKNRLPNIAIIDAQLDLDGEKSYLKNVLWDKNKQKAIGHLSMLATQGHLVDQDDWDTLEFQDFDLVRLGKVRNSIEECEPLIREVDGLAFNISAIRQSEAPAQTLPMPSGLFIEEACQLVRYAGINERLSSVGFYGFEQKHDVADQTAKCIALMAWYFIDGVASRKNDYPISTTEMVEYIVEVKGFTLPLTFWKSNKSGRWWIQIPNSKSKKEQNYLFSCSYKDYKEACSGELPERIWNGFKRLS